MSLNGIYELRLCAFVDILGFRDLVRRSVDRPSLQIKIQQALREVFLARPVWERDNPTEIVEARLRQEGVVDPRVEAEQLVNERAAAERGYSFSDSLVLSATHNDRSITDLVTSLLALSVNLAELGVFVRGAVCLGQLCHEQDLCFGPALIDAIDLEEDKTNGAKFPRIVFSSEAYNLVAQVDLPRLGPLSLYLRQDADDGWRFLDFLNQTDPDLAPEVDQLRVIRRELARQLFNPQFRDDVCVRGKLDWLARYFDLVLNETNIPGINPLSPSKHR